MKSKLLNFRFLALTFVAIAAMLSMPLCAEESTVPKKIVMVRFDELVGVEDAEKAILQGLASEGLKEGKDFVTVSKSAQGDLPTLVTLVKSISPENCDLAVPLQAITLQVFLAQKELKMPIVFHLQGDPFHLGAGTDDKNHLPGVTGSYIDNSPESLKNMIRILKKLMPNLNKAGVVFDTSVDTSVGIKDKLQAAYEKESIAVEAISVPDVFSYTTAIEALRARGVQVVHGTPTILTAWFTSADNARIPIIGMIKSHVDTGCLFTLAPDLKEGGIEAGKQIARIFKGENPAAIPFFAMKRKILAINKHSADRFGLTIPPDLASEAIIVK
ncbi:MAG: ABC transporter substrate-binding protein [Candidatus Ozemobacteraceae bacterium]